MTVETGRRVITQVPGRFVDVNGLRTNVISTGSGPALVILHGASPGGCARVIYGPCIEPLAAAGLSVYASDGPGFGLTEAPDDLSAEYRLEHTKALIDALGITRYHVLGNSAGVLPALRLGLEDARVDKVVVIGGGGVAGLEISAEAREAGREHGAYLQSYTPGLENMRELTLGTLHRDEFVSDELVQLRYEMSIGVNDETAKRRRAGGFRATYQPTKEDLATRYTRPTLVVWGKNDHGSVLELGYRTSEAIPGAEMHVFDNCGHWPMWDQTEGFVRVVTEFLLRD